MLLLALAGISVVYIFIACISFGLHKRWYDTLPSYGEDRDWAAVAITALWPFCFIYHIIRWTCAGVMVWIGKSLYDAGATLSDWIAGVTEDEKDK